jgi:hypothetical protein
MCQETSARRKEVREGLRVRLPRGSICCLLNQEAAEFGVLSVQSRVLIILLVAGLAACTHGGSGSVNKHYIEFETAAPNGNRVTVCHAHSCKMQTPYTISKQDIAEIAAIMKKVKRGDTAHEERRAVAYAIAAMEAKVGNELGIRDKPGMQWSAAGKPSQQDCVDEATNTTSYLLVLEANGLIAQHTVQMTMSKDKLVKGILTLRPVKYWPHYTAVLQEKATGQKWAVDSWLSANGENPAVVKVEDWYIKDNQ